MRGVGRRNRPRRGAGSSSGAPAAAGWTGTGFAGTEEDEDGRWAVRTVTGGRAAKTYRCPGCDHEIRPGTPHVVTWSLDDPVGGEDRRHWHTGCWRGRHTRGLTRRWS